MSTSLERLTETANICAGHASTALAELLDATLLFEPPAVHRLAAGQALETLFPAEDRVAAVFVELEGALRARAAILLSAVAVEEVLARVAGKSAEDSSEISLLTVLSEVGNIALSAAANALALLLGTRTLPSVPRAGYAREGRLAMRELESGASREQFVWVVELIERGGPLRIQFVLIPAGEAIV